MEILGDRIIIKPLKLEHIFQMRNWGYHSNPLLGDYNFPAMSDHGINQWYKMKTKHFFDSYYGILNKEAILIGYLGIKNVKFIRRQSTLGIVLDPNYIDQAYGSEALEYFLRYYFSEMKMKRMYLEVAEFNKRAYSLYKKMGFKSIAYYLSDFFDPYLDLNGSHYKESKDCFVIEDGKIYNYIHMMRLDKKDFWDNMKIYKE